MRVASIAGRSTVARKLVLVLALLLALFAAIAAIALWALQETRGAVEDIASTTEPMRSAAHEMEIATTGTGLAVRAYLASAEPDFRERFMEDEESFWRAHARYLSFARLADDRELGDEAGALYAELAGLGRLILDGKDVVNMTAAEVIAGAQEAEALLDTDAVRGTTSEILALFERLSANVGRLRAEADLVAARVTSPSGDRLEQSAASLERALSAFAAIPLSAPQRGIVDTVRAELAEVADAQTMLVERSRDLEGATVQFVELRGQLERLLDSRIEVRTTATLQEAQASATSIASDATWIVLGTALAALGIAAGGGAFALRRIRGPVRELTAGAARIGAGELDHRIPAGGRDEIAGLASAFNRMASDLHDARRVLEHERADLEATVAARTAALRASERLDSVGRLAGGVAHDFNNLLTAILGYGELALERLAPSDPARDDVVEMIRMGERAAALTNQLLTFGRRQPTERRAIDLNVAVADLAGMLRRVTPSNIELRLELDDGPVRAFADRVQVEQVMLNLVVNARDALAEGGAITMATGTSELGSKEAASLGLPAGGYTWLRVADTGPGIDAAVRERLFEPFFTTKEGQGGTGLGLAVVYGIVAEHGGAIDVASEPGRGAAFTVYLPPAAAEPDEDGRPEEPADARGSERVLVADDHDDVRAIAVTVLRSRGYEVLEARNGDEALELVTRAGARVDLVLTDVIMPRAGGRALAERLEEASPGVKIVVMSGYLSREATMEQLPFGDAFLPKPFTPGELSRTVRETLDGRRGGTSPPES